MPLTLREILTLIYKPKDFFVLCLIVFAFILQMQITLFQTETYLGLRVNVADLILPFLMIYCLYTLLRKKTVFPNLVFNQAYYYLIVLIAIVVLSFVRGYYALGHISGWALINKTVGFFILVSYFFIGAWIISNVKNVKKAFNIFMIFYILCFILVLIIPVLFSPILYYFKIHRIELMPELPWQGLMGNRNAFMVAMIPAFSWVVYHLTQKKEDKDAVFLDLPDWLYKVFWFLIGMFLVFNGSRAGYLVLLPLFVYLIFKLRMEFLKKILPFMLLGFLCTYVLAHTLYTKYVGRLEQVRNFSYAVTAKAQDDLYVGDQVRVITLEDALSLYQQSNPLLGAGLGVYKEFQIEKRGAFIEVIDCAPLWLLTETGLLGLIGFSGFFLLCLRAVWLQSKGACREYYFPIFVFLLGFSVMALFHEITYTRIVWFILGMSLAKVKTNQISVA